MKDIVVDSQTMVDAINPTSKDYSDFFHWLFQGKVSVLTYSKKLYGEYLTYCHRDIIALVDYKIRLGFAVFFSPEEIKAFTSDKKYKYTCNKQDHAHAKLVFLSVRKKLITKDNRLNADVNGFNKIQGIQPEAREIPTNAFYS